jgi:hypothetical protein
MAQARTKSRRWQFSLGNILVATLFFSLCLIIGPAPDPDYLPKSIHAIARLCRGPIVECCFGAGVGSFFGWQGTAVGAAVGLGIASVLMAGVYFGL